MCTKVYLVRQQAIDWHYMVKHWRIPPIQIGGFPRISSRGFRFHKVKNPEERDNFEKRGEKDRQMGTEERFVCRTNIKQTFHLQDKKGMKKGPPKVE